MGKLFLIFLSNSNPQMQSDFSFKSKTPFGKSLIMKAFFKGLWQRTHEKMGEKKEFELQKDCSASQQPTCSLCPPRAVGLMLHPTIQAATSEQCLSAAPSFPLLSSAQPQRMNSFTQQVSNRQTPSPPHPSPRARSSSRHPATGTR